MGVGGVGGCREILHSLFIFHFLEGGLQEGAAVGADDGGGGAVGWCGVTTGEGAVERFVEEFDDVALQDFGDALEGGERRGGVGAKEGLKGGGGDVQSGGYFLIGEVARDDGAADVETHVFSFFYDVKGFSGLAGCSGGGGG